MNEVVTILVLAAHLLAMNVASAGPLLAAWRRPRGERGSVRLAAWSLAALAAGAALGAVLLAIADDGMRAALSRFPSSAYLYAGAELVFSAVCIAAMVVLQRRGRLRRWAAWALALLSSSNLLYHFPPLMIVLSKLAANPAWTNELTIDRASLLRLWLRPEVLALWIHFVLASVAVTAIAALWPVRRADDDEASAAIQGLAATALIASLVQIPVGAWIVVASSGAVRDAMLGSDPAASGLFAAGLLAAMAMLYSLATIALGDCRGSTRRRAAWLLAAVAVLMTAMLRTSRAPVAQPGPLHAAISTDAERTTSPSQPLLSRSSRPLP